MDRFLLDKRAGTNRPLGDCRNRKPVVKLNLFSCLAKMRHDSQKLPVDLTDVTLGRAGQPHSVREQCIENRLKLGR